MEVALVVSLVASVVSLAMTLSMKPTAPSVNDSGSSIDRKGQNNPKVIPFGRCIVPGVRVWNNVNNMNTNYLGQVYSFGAGPIKSFEQIYIDGVNYFRDGEQIAANRWYGIRHSGEFPNAMMGLRLGAYTETAHGELIGHSDGEWTADHRGDRVASAGVLVERWINKKDDNDVRFISDRVKVEALLHGNAVIDPRFSMFERNWVNDGRNSYRNPACVLFTYLVDTYYGLGLPMDAINVDDFIELANYCDGKNYTFDGYIDQDGDFGSIILDMCTSFDGMAYVEDGKVRVKADKLTYPVCHIDEDDMVGSFRLSNTNDSSYFNVVNVEFVNENANHTVDKYVIPKDVLTNPTVIADGFEKTKDLKLTYTSDNGDFNKVRRIANKHLRKARYQQTIEFEVDNTEKVFKVLDVIEVTNSDYGLDKKQFRVVKIETTLDDKTTTSKVVAEQYEPSVYDEMNLDDGITSPPVKPPTTTIPSPVGLKFELTGFSLSGQGKLSWTTRYNREGRSVVEYKLASSSDWKRAGEVQLDEYNFNGLRPDTYDFRVMTRSFVGSTSQWVELKGVQIKGGLVLPTVTGMKSVFTNETCIISWDDMKVKPLNITAAEVYDGVKTVADVFSHYEVIVYKGDTPKYTETLSSDSNVFTYTYDMNVKSGVNRALKFEVRVVAVDGSEGKVAAVTAKNAQAEQASGVEVSGKLVQLNARWDQPKDKDFAATDIHISSVSNFTPSASTLVETTTGGTVVIQREYEGMHYLRVGHYDKFGKDGMTYSAPQGFVMQDIDDLLDNSNNFDGILGDISDIVGDIGGIMIDITDIDKEVAGVQADVTKAKQDIIKNATEINKTNTTVSTQGAKIEENKQAITSTNGNLAELETSVTAELDGVKAGVNSNKTSIATTDKALSDYKTSVTAEFNGVKSSINTNKTAIADTNKALTSYKTEVKAEFDKANAAINVNKTSIADANKALSDYKTSVTAEFNGVKANITSNQTAIANVNTALTSYKTEVKAELDKANAAINTNKTSIATTDKALSDYKTSVAAEFNGVKANITANQTAIADDKKALADYKTVVKADFDKANAAINSNKTAIANDVKALADYKTTVTAELNGVKSSVTQNSQAIAGVDGKVNALHTIKLESGGKVSGLIMANDGQTSTFDVIADKFRVSSKAGDQAVFQVNSTSGEILMRTALIKDLTATNIKAGSITGNSIASNTKIIAGSGNASVVMDGADATWRLYAGHATGGSAPFRVNKDGALFATNANITGHVVANSGTFRGDVYANNGVFNGTVNASSGTFNGTVNANAGTFNNVTIAENCQVLGTLYADRIVGLPVGTRFSQGESGWTVSSDGNWVTGMALPLPNPQGRFTVDMMFGGRFELEHVGQGTSWTAELIRDGQVISSVRGHISGSGWQPISSFSGIPISCGNHGGTISLRIKAHNGQGKVRFRWLNGYMYTAIANPAFWEG